jgi:hypothetical protein
MIDVKAKLEADMTDVKALLEQLRVGGSKSAKQLEPRRTS